MANLLAFRITNFRSIVDSGWVTFSNDGITALIGQNESGKTSIIEALYAALNCGDVTADDFRIGSEHPVVFLKAKIDWEEVLPELKQKNATDAIVEAATIFLEELSHVVTLEVSWPLSPETKKYSGDVVLLDAERFLSLQATYSSQTETTDKLTPTKEVSAEDSDEAEDEQEEPKQVIFTIDDISECIYRPLPAAILFNTDSGLLPNAVDIDQSGQPTGSGATAAKNFLAIAKVDLPTLVKQDARYRQNILNKANDRISADFTNFWSQIIGQSSRLEIKCEIAHYPSTAGEKAGKQHLVFWVSDGNTQLYLKQRSLGVRWYVSFYLQLRATEMNGANRVFLLDEPGANLHAKAQEDVLKLINQLRKSVPVVYSTHSPKMLEFDKLFRIRAAQRTGDQEDSPTAVIDGHQLASASSDTLSPILAAMGSDMSQQAVIKKFRNVLLEEISGFYYIKAFWKLFNIRTEAHFIPSTGVNKIPMLANMFLGWGLDFIVAIDDDKQGREVFNQLKKEMFGDRDELARAQLLKLPNSGDIEEIFSRACFAKHVLKDPAAHFSGSNADYLKTNQISKPMKALEFYLSVNAGEIKLENFEQTTIDNAKTLTDSICQLLEKRSKA